MKESEQVQFQRNSSIELLRIIAMWVIVFYHFHVHVLSVESDTPFFKAIQIPFHISVPIFVLISGYFGIHFSVKGLSKFVTQIGFYSLLLLLAFSLINIFFPCPHPVTRGQIIDGLCFISRTNNLWFIRTYLLLYLLSPFWNKVLQGQNIKQRLLLLIILAFIVLYVGIVGQVPGLDGKSIIYFLFVYTIGNTISEYNLGEKFSAKGLLLFFFIVNLTLIIFYIALVNNTLARVAILTIAFKYNSPICILSASVIFLIFSKLHIDNLLINKIAVSVFAVYLISENALVNIYLNDFVRYLMNSYSTIIMYLILVTFTTVVFASCVGVDRITLNFQKNLSNGVYYCLNKVKELFMCFTNKYIKA